MFGIADRVEAVGILAGALISVSAMPKVIQIARRPHEAIHESLVRNELLVAGNIGKQMALHTLGLLARVIARAVDARPPFSAPFTL